MVKKSLIFIALFITWAVKLVAQAPSAFEFVENKGQWDSQVRFKGTLNAGSFYLGKNGFTVVQHNADDLAQYLGDHRQFTGQNSPAQASGRNQKARNLSNQQLTFQRPDSIGTVRSHAYKVQFVGGAENPVVIPDKVLPGVANYFIGNDRSKWATNVRSYAAILYKNVYPNIDVRYYSENGHLKYDLIVNPGGNVNDIAMRYDGADKLSIKNQELVIKTSVAEVKELYPYSYQFDQVHGRQDVSCSYKLEGKNIIRFNVNNYSGNSTLIIDPTLIFSSYTGSPIEQWGFTATPGPDGSFYSAGIVFGSGFPVSPGAYKTGYSRGGHMGIDIGIFKFTPDGTQRSYATYLGGTEDEFPHSLICDGQGNLVVLGRTYSTDYPGTHIGNDGGCDMVVTKLNSTGTGIIGSLRIGGQGNDGLNIEDQMESENHKINSLLRNYGDDSHSEVILDAAANIYVAGQSQSDDFPTTSNVFQPKRKGAQDGVVLKINPDCNSIIWASFLGGSQNDAAFVLALRPSTQEIYVSGGTESHDFPGMTAGVYKQTMNDTDVIDPYVSIISNDGTTLIKSTYMGTKSVDINYGIQFDKDSYPYVLGVTRGSWPVTSNVNYFNQDAKQYIVKLQPDLSAMVYSTTFGNGNRPNISPVAFLVDRCENVYVSGWGGWYLPPPKYIDPYDLAGTAGMPVTADAMRKVSDNRDFYFIVLTRNSNSLLYGTFFGQDGGFGEHVDGGTSRYDQQGVIYQAMCVCYGNGLQDYPVSSPYPTTPNAWSPGNGTGNKGCNLGAVKISFNFAGVGSGPKAYFNNAFDTVGCIPFTVTFKDTVLDAKTYIWNFGDGSGDVKTDNYDVTHTFNKVGAFRISLVAIDSTTCNIADTAYVTIHARDDSVHLAYLATKLQPCEALSYKFDNTSTFPPGKPFNANSFIWDMGDGTRLTPAQLSVTHGYASAGTYITRLILNDTSYCNSPDSISKTLRVSPLVKAKFETPPYGCAPYTAVFNNTSLAGQQFSWNFGDGSTSSEDNPTHEYTNVGTYHVSLVAVDSSTCNKIDSTSMDITVYPLPVADFTASPVPPEVNKPTVFTNSSTGGTRYEWLFGDGDSAIRKTTDTVMHQYNSTGTFNACLIAFNDSGCTDTVCKSVDAIINPLLDVPNAFTPGRFGRNAIVTVTGFGITKMNWKIYNRWGKLVFESTDRYLGWDGTYKGELQPMDVYAYVLDVEFFDGKKLRKTGDITLIR